MTTTDSVAAAADDLLASSRLSRVLIAAVRIGVAFLWIQNLGWKNPPTFGQGDPPAGLYVFTKWAVDFPVFPPYAWVVQHLVLPNFAPFAWAVLLVEAGLGAFLLVGLATRFWALVGIAQTLAISLSVINAPNEWPWAYLMMLMIHATIFATAAGRYFGLDGILRSRWQLSDARTSRLLVMVS